ncbi:hypothetical protein BH23GEM4_BH23GEM4_15500 [soil metagenome]|jgi:plasmid stability protein
MAQVLVRNLDSETVDKLKDRARRNGRSLQAEAKTILETAAGRRREDFWKLADELREEIGPRPHTDSTELVREDRER